MDGGDADNPEVNRNISRRGTRHSKSENENVPYESTDQKTIIENKLENEEINNIKGEKTIVCWNCQTVLMVKDEWNVVQCTNCDKINRVPNTSTDVNNQLRINDNLNHFDLYLPYVVLYFYLSKVHYNNMPILQN